MNKVYVLGDSISIGYGPYLQAYLQGTMSYARKEAEDPGDPQGANGGDSRQVLSFLEAVARSGDIDADLLLVNCGLHDLRTDPHTGQRQVPVDAYVDNLRAIVRTAASLRPEMVWIRTTPCDEAVHNRPGMGFYRYAADCMAYNRAADRVMREAGVPSIDLHTFTVNLGPDLYCDHVHFSEDIRQKQAAFIAGWLAAFFRDTRTNPFSGPPEHC